MGAEAGLASAVAVALGEAGASLPVRGCDAAQLDLLGEGRVTRAAVEALPRGRGRPPGAANRRTAAWREYLTSRYTHPLETLAAIQSTPADVLAAQLGCKPIEALAVIKSAAAELAPYLEGKMPVAIALGVRGDLTVAFAGLTHSEAEVRALAAEGIWAAGEVIENDAVFSDDEGASE